MKPILMLKDHPTLVELEKQYDEKMKFIVKRLDSLKTEVEENKKSFWETVESYLVEKGIDLDAHKKQLCVRDDVLYHGGGNKGSLLEQLLEHVTK